MAFLELHPTIKPLYKAGDRVKLRELREEDGFDPNVPQEIGTICDDPVWSGTLDDGCYMYVTQVDEEFRDTDTFDDGLREHGEEDIVEVLGESKH